MSDNRHISEQLHIGSSSPFISCAHGYSEQSVLIPDLQSTVIILPSRLIAFLKKR